MTKIIPTMTGEGRVFINLSEQICDTTFDFHACMGVSNLSRQVGDVTSIVCPSSTAFNQFDEVATIQAPSTRWSSAMSGMLPVNVESPLENIVRNTQKFGVQVHYGECALPSDFNDFTVALIMTDVLLTSYSLDTLTALTQDQLTAVNESADISVGDYFRVFNLNWGPTQTVSNLVLDIDWCRVNGCNTQGQYVGLALGYEDSVSGAQPIFHVSLDNGLTWSNVNVLGTGTAATPQAMGFHCFSGEVVYYYGHDTDTGSTVYHTTVDELVAGSTNTTQVAVTVSSEQFLRFSDESDRDVYFVGGNTALSATGGSYGLMYEKRTGIVTVFDNHTLFPNSLGTVGARWDVVFALDDDHVVIGGNEGGAVVLGAPYAFSSSRGVFSTGRVVVNGTPVNEAVTFIHMFNETEWLFILSGGSVVCTGNAGTTWSLVGTHTSLLTPVPRKRALYKGTLGYQVNSNGIFRTLDLWRSDIVAHQPSSAPDFGFVTAIHPNNPNLVLASVPSGLGNSDFIIGKV